LNNIPYRCIKLNSGDTLFSEVLGEERDKTILCNPLLIISDKENELAMVPWVPYSDNAIVDISSNAIILSQPLSKQFFEYYGKVVIQLEINRIKYRMMDSIQDKSGDIAVEVFLEGLNEIKQVCDDLSKKFGVEPPDFSEFESMVQKQKSNIVLH
jgi:hypothetical protein